MYSTTLFLGTYSFLICGSNNKIASTAKNESWKPTSNSALGLETSITNAAKAKPFRDEFSRPMLLQIASIENIISALVIEYGKPIIKA